MHLGPLAACYVLLLAVCGPLLARIADRPTLRPAVTDPGRRGWLTAWARRGRPGSRARPDDPRRPGSRPRRRLRRINPGLWSGAVGHHFARPGNRFWKALHGSGFTGRLLAPSEDAQLLERNLGDHQPRPPDERPPPPSSAPQEDRTWGARARAAAPAAPSPGSSPCLESARRTGFGRRNAALGPQDDSTRRGAALGPAEPERPERTPSAR